MPARVRGLYEQLVTREVADELRSLATQMCRQRPLGAAEAADRLALHIGRILRQCLDDVADEDRVQHGVELAGELLCMIGMKLGRSDLSQQTPTPNVLQAIGSRMPDGSVEVIQEPLIPLLDTTLLTNSPGEPRIGSQIQTEIASADAIDLIMAFVRRSGLMPLRAALESHCLAGRPLRVLTTTYTGSTEPAALKELCDLGAEVRVSYDTTATRLHAKAWLFHRESGFSTAYIGSSNLTHSAQVTGLEWNIRAAAARNPDVVAKMKAVFETYWSSTDFEPFDLERFESAVGRPEPALLLAPLQLRLEPFQERLLEQIAAARACGRHRNLLVSATGTGKTVMAAVDYQRLRHRMPRSRLLFVAHRQELLGQARRTFAYALRDAAFGEEWVAGRHPQRFDHVFASIQSLTANGMDDVPADHFDMVIIDEFHHAAASSYRAVLERLKPIELLGLTATPERSDGQSVLTWFDGRIAAELRLWDAIDQHRLTPFSYFGVTDGTDLREVPWRRGRGYDIAALSSALTTDRAYFGIVLNHVHSKVADVSRMRAIGFCVSVAHAEFMARNFTAHGVPAVAVSSDTPEPARAAALRELADGRLRIVFAVDLFNEGVDVPAVDTLLLLRPTESGTLFLQQLGRGLRKHAGKSTCTVLDFVGHHRHEFRFDLRLRSLLRGDRQSIAQQVESGFPFLPAGCHMEMDPIARKVVLESLRSAVPNRWTARVDELRRFQQGKSLVTLAEFLRVSDYELEDLYAGDRGWSDLMEAAGLPVLPSGPSEDQLRKAIGRQTHVNDSLRLESYRRWLQQASPPSSATLTASERRLLRMLVWPMVAVAVPKDASLDAATGFLWQHPQVCRELAELYAVLQDRIDRLTTPLRAPVEVPLRVHARYTRKEILAAFATSEMASAGEWREGVRHVADHRTDLLAFTLDKSKGGFSPTTRYRDYAISRERIHWESQSTTAATSPTGQRYCNHAAVGSVVLLFARHNTSDRAFWCLGPARYVAHSGSRPMAITWELEVPLPADLYVEFAAAVA